MLFIGICSADCSERTIPVLENVTVEFLPRNSTSMLQRTDAGIIAGLKLCYLQRQYEFALARSDTKTKNI